MQSGLKFCLSVQQHSVRLSHFPPHTHTFCSSFDRLWVPVSISATCVCGRDLHGLQLCYLTLLFLFLSRSCKCHLCPFPNFPTSFTDIRKYLYLPRSADLVKSVTVVRLRTFSQFKSIRITTSYYQSRFFCADTNIVLLAV